MGSEQARFDGLCRSGDIVQVRLDRVARHGVPFPEPSRRGVEHHSFLNDQHPRDAAHARAPKRARARAREDCEQPAVVASRRLKSSSANRAKRCHSKDRCIDLLRYAAVLSSRCRHDHARRSFAMRELLSREMTKFRRCHRRGGFEERWSKGGIRRTHAVEAT